MLVLRKQRWLWLLLVVFWLPASSFAASYQQQCTLVDGKIVKLPRNPVFRFNSSKKYSNNNYPMTHTQFFIETGNGETYKVVVDNLFYNNLSQDQAISNSDMGIIADFNRNFKVGDNVSACGKPFDKDGKLGLHFVHPSACHETKFNGFLRINGEDITSNTKYCDSCSCKLNKY